MEWRFGNYRWYILVDNNAAHWNVKAEKQNGNSYTLDWEQHSHNVPANLNKKWFLLEIFWKLSAERDSLVKVAIDGNTIITHQGRNRLSNANKPQYHLFKVYGENGKIHQYVDDLEIWSDVPCANFPCG